MLIQVRKLKPTTATTAAAHGGWLWWTVWALSLPLAVFAAQEESFTTTMTTVLPQTTTTTPRRRRTQTTNPGHDSQGHRRLQQETPSTGRGNVTMSTNAIFDVTAVDHAPAPAAHVGHKTVLVTGAAGFVGSHVAELLLSRGDRVIVVDEVNDYYDVAIKESNLQLLRDKGGSNVQIYRGDICNVTLMQGIFENEQPNWVVHLAARAGVRPSILDPFVYIHSNIQGTTRLLELAIQYKVVNFVMASTSSVYGGSKSTLFDEHEDVDFPISPYAASKRVTELMGTYYHSKFGLPITALRFFTVYGPRGRPDMAPFKFIDWTARGKPIQQFGNGSSSRDYTFIDDIVAGVVGALDRPTPIYQNVNLGKGSGTSLSQFVQLVAKYVGKQPEIKILPDQPGDVPYTCANVTRAHVMLDYTPSIPFETGIAKTVEWYKQTYPYSLDDKPNQNKGADTTKQAGADKAVATKETSQVKRRRRLQSIGPNQDKKKVLVVAQQESPLVTEHVVNRLTERGDSVAVLIPNSCFHDALEDVHAYGFKDMDHVSIHTGCTDNATFLEQIFARESPNWVCYLNSLSSSTESKEDPYTYIDVNIQSFVRLLEVVRKHKVLNLVVTSSTQVYQPEPKWHFESETIPKFDSPHAVTQKGRELFAHTWHSLYGIPTTALRIPQVYGPGKCSWCGHLHLEESNTLVVDEEEITQVQEFIYVDDAVNGILRALDRPYPYQILNLGQGEDFVEEACQSQASLRKMVLAKLKGQFFSTNLIKPCRLAGVDKAHERLGFASQVRLREGIGRMAEWFWDHPELLPPSALPKPVPNGNGPPPLPWEENGTDTLSSQAVSNLVGLPKGVEALAQVQWIVVGIFALYKLLSCGRKRNT